MVALLASIVGFISSVVPEILKLIKDKNERQHTMDMLDKKAYLACCLQEHSLKKMEFAKDLAEHTAIIYTTYKTGIAWIDAINGTVRPILAYSFFFMYAIIKIIQYKSLTIQSTIYITEFINILWTSDDQAIFAGIISFYFGQRTFSKLRHKSGLQQQHQKITFKSKNKSGSKLK